MKNIFSVTKAKDMFNRVTTVTDTDIKRRQLPGTVQEDVFQRRMFVPQKDGCFMGQTASMTRETPDGVPGSLIDIDSYLRYETRRQTGILFDEPATETPGFFSNEIQYASCDLQIEPERQKVRRIQNPMVEGTRFDLPPSVQTMPTPLIGRDTRLEMKDAFRQKKN